jgi:hypothetical protein
MREMTSEHFLQATIITTTTTPEITVIEKC